MNMNPRQSEIDALLMKKAKIQQQIEILDAEMRTIKNKIAELRCPLSLMQGFHTVSSGGRKYVGIVSKIVPRDTFPFFRVHACIFDPHKDYLLVYKNKEVFRIEDIITIENSQVNLSGIVQRKYLELKEKGEV